MEIRTACTSYPWLLPPREYRYTTSDFNDRDLALVIKNEKYKYMHI